MTTNKPEVVSVYRTGTGETDEMVRLSDYEALQAESEKLREDAELYRALRSMHWHDSPLAVVRNPKEAVKLGHDCPSGDRLDEILEEYISETPNPGEA